MSNSNDNSCGLSETMEDFHLSEEDAGNIGASQIYERDHEIDVIDGFYLEEAMNIANDKIRICVEYWMKLYSDCCVQRNEALGWLEADCLDEAKKTMEDWPQTFGCPKVPQLLPELREARKRKKPNPFVDASSLVQEMRNKLSPRTSDDFHYDVPNDQSFRADIFGGL